MFCKRRLLICIVTIILLAALNITLTASAEAKDDSIVEARYSAVINAWKEAGYKDTQGISINITPEQFMLDEGEGLISKEEAYGYKSRSAYLESGRVLSFVVNVPIEGLYTISFDYFILNNGLISSEAGIQVNGEYQYYEARRIIFPVYWENKNSEFARDRYNNEIMPWQNRIQKWQNTLFADASHILPKGLRLKLNQGENTIRLIPNSGELLMGNICVSSPEKAISYKEYKEKNHNNASSKGVLLVQEAEKTSYKNDTSINAIVKRDLEVSPYDTYAMLLNTIGGSTWQKGGQAVYYKINISEDGLYRLAFKYLQDIKANAASYRKITIDNKVPFEELEYYSFKYANKWTTAILGDGQEAYSLYLTKGEHVIGLEVSIPYNEAISTIAASIIKMNELSLQIKKLTGGSSDIYRDWEIADYIPTIEEDLNSIVNSLEIQYEALINLNNGNENSQGLIFIRTAIGLLRGLAKEPDEIPSSLGQLSEGSGSAVQALSKAAEEFEKQPLIIDQFYIYSEDKQPPKYKASFFTRLTEGIKRFFHSFAPQKDKLEKNTITLNVWVNRARNYLDLMQKMADEQFTARTNIRINFSLMPNEQKLILANASGTSPDIALGISNWLPYELGIRGAALDLRQFADFNAYMGSFSPGALIPMIVEEKVYGMPETQDFYVLFYRRDILDYLNIPIPDTWEDVKSILPELQRYGMNFYTSLSGSSGSKPFMATAPFIYQSGGDMYTEDGMGTAIDEEAALGGITLMTELFTIYGLPQQVPNFYEHFRSGALPIGIGNFANYVQLMNAAPELRGAWAIAKAPGIEGNDGVIASWQPGSAQASMIFGDTQYKEEAWEFLKWWMDADTQEQFANQLQSLYGAEYMWNTANLDAFRQLPLPKEHKDIILEQWQWLKEVPKLPGGYMVERELSNIWNKVVFEGKNQRAAVDEAVIRVNKEIRRKMEEFGYVEGNKILKPYIVPTIEQVEGWVKAADGNR